MKVKFPYGSTVENNQLLLPQGMLTVDLDKKAIRIHDGLTLGGFEMVGVQAYYPPPASMFQMVDPGIGANVAFPALHYANNMWVAIDISGGRVMTSTNGITWTDRGTFGGEIWDVVFHNGIWVAVGYQSSNTRVMTSTDGINWTNQSVNLGTNRLSDTIAAGNGIFVAGVFGNTTGRIMTSTNGVSWTMRDTGVGTNWTHVVRFVSGHFVATASMAMATSTDGITWTQRGSIAEAAGNYITDVVYANGLYLVTASNGYVFTSPDLTTWTRRLATELGTEHVSGACFGSGVFAVASYKKLYTSPDGITWTSRYPTPLPTSQNMNQLRFGGGKFIVSGSDGKFYVSP